MQMLQPAQQQSQPFPHGYAPNKYSTLLTPFSEIAQFLLAKLQSFYFDNIINIER